MAYQDWVSLINDSLPGAGAGVALSTATTATLSPVAGSTADVAQVNPAAAGGWYPGMLVRVTARGFLTTTAVSTTAAFALAARVGNSGAAYVTLAAHAKVLNTGTGAITGIPWKLEGLIRCTQVAASGNTLASQAELYIGDNPATAQTVGTATAGINLYLPSASGEQVAAVDTTQLQGISLRGTLAAAAATVQLTQWLVEGLN
jgi:hypothetical protein